MTNANNEKKNLSFLSFLSFVVSIIAIGLYTLVFKTKSIIPVWMFVSFASVILPAIAKKIRISKRRNGKGFEIAALIIGGFAFCTVIFAATNLNICIGYLGWIIGGIIYKIVK